MTMQHDHNNQNAHIRWKTIFSSMVRLLFSVDCKESLRVFPHELITWFVNAYIYDCIYMYMYIYMILSRSEERRRNCIFSERCTCIQYKILLFMDGIPLIPQNGFNFLPHSDILTTINITRIHSKTLRICSSTQIPLPPAACAPASTETCKYNQNSHISNTMPFPFMEFVYRSLICDRTSGHHLSWHISNGVNIFFSYIVIYFNR